MRIRNSAISRPTAEQKAQCAKARPASQGQAWPVLLSVYGRRRPRPAVVLKMAAVDLFKLVKEKRFWVASFLVAWAAALQVPRHGLPSIQSPIRLRFQIQKFHFLVHQGHMMWMQRQEAFKHKFGADASDASSPLDSSST